MPSPLKSEVTRKIHIPLIKRYSCLIKSQGVNHIYLMFIENPFDLNQWYDEMNLEGDIDVLCDPRSELTESIGQADTSPNGKRYSMVIENGKIVVTNVEPDPETFLLSGPNRMIDQLMQLKMEKQDRMQALE